MPRPKGSPNKITHETKEFLQQILSDERPNIKSALNELYASNKLHYLQAIIKLLPFITPKASEVHLHTPDLPVKPPSWFDDKPLETVKSMP